MPLLITPAAPLQTTSGLEVHVLYAIVDEYTYVRRTRQAQFRVAYYLDEAASLPTSDLAELPISLARAFSFRIEPSQLQAVGDVMPALEAFAQLQLLTLLPDATIETVD
jgi:hypothetical protein